MLQRILFTLISLFGLAVAGLIPIAITVLASQKFQAVKRHSVEICCLLIAIVFCPAVYNYKSNVSYKCLATSTSYGIIDNQPRVIETKVYKSNFFGYSYETRDISQNVKWVPKRKITNISTDTQKETPASKSESVKVSVVKKHNSQIPKEMTAKEYQEVEKVSATPFIQQVDGHTYVYPHITEW